MHPQINLKGENDTESYIYFVCSFIGSRESGAGHKKSESRVTAKD